jgi:D-alanyl-D-alanine carboxypeptidase
MARRYWLIGGAGLAIVLLASVPSSPDETAATSGSSLSSTTSAAELPATTAIAAAPQTSTTSTTTTSTSTTTTTTTTPATVTTSPATTTTTPPTKPATFNAQTFDAVIAAATVDIGDLSAGVAVIRDGKTLHTAAFGMENPFEGRAATSHTMFRLASVSKMLTAVTIMQLVDEGSVELDRPFLDQLGVAGPFNDPRLATITVRQLLSHTSGLPVSRDIFFGHGVDDWHQAAASALGQLLLFDPGTAFKYSNSNFCLLGLLIEKVTGQTFDDAIEERVLEPIGAKAHLAPTFDTAAGDALHASGTGRNYMEVLGPAGQWVATPLDVAKIAAALRDDSPGHHLLDLATVDEMRVPIPVPVEIPPPVVWWSYGLGTMLFADGSWGHTGTIESTHSIVVNRPDGLTIAVMVSGKFPEVSDDLVTIIADAVTASATP